MPESIQHTRLVRTIAAWVGRSYGADYRNMYIVVDDPEQSLKPDIIGGFRPDLYAAASGRLAIIGEAKTTSDLERPHTEQQLAAFMQHLDALNGGLLVVATPWPAAASARNLVVNLKRRLGFTNVALRVLTDLDR